MKKRPVIVFVFSQQGTQNSTRYSGFATRLQKAPGFPDADVITVALANLVYRIDEDGSATVKDVVSGFDLGEADFVYFKSWRSMPNEAAALGHYLLGRGVAFADTLVLGKGTSKLVTLFRQWRHGLKVPTTLYSLDNSMLRKELATGILGEKFVMKDAEGSKGKNNFLVTAPEVQSLLEKHSNTQFIFQRFIPNNGDYRVGVYGEEARFVLCRKSVGLSHLNNTSAGGVGEYMRVKDVSKDMLRIAAKAADASDLQIAGVDVIQDKNTKRWFVLEVNQGSQIVTGALTDENMAGFNRGLSSMVRNRLPRLRTKPRKVIGRRAVVQLPGLDVVSAIAKIDTGAYSSALHAENIREIMVNQGEKALAFDIVPGDTLKTAGNKVVRVVVGDYFTQKVKSSNGHVEERYSIRTPLSVDGIRFSATLTLSDRSAMGYPLLIGRKILRSRFMVNVELDEDHKVTWKY